MLVIDQCIKWNKNQARKAKDPRDKARYEENVRNLEEYKESENGREA